MRRTFEHKRSIIFLLVIHEVTLDSMRIQLLKHGLLKSTYPKNIKSGIMSVVGVLISEKALPC